MATKIKLMRLGKIRAPYYRVVIADSRTKRDGRSIETIGRYDPKADPSIITIDNERALYWLGVGAQPTEAVAALLRVTGTWQQFKGLPAPPPMLMAPEKVDKKSVFEDAARSAAGLKTEEETAAKVRPAKKAADKPAVDKAATDKSATDKPVKDKAAADKTPADKPVAETDPAAKVAEDSTDSKPAEAAAEAVVAVDAPPVADEAAAAPTDEAAPKADNADAAPETGA